MLLLTPGREQQFYLELINQCPLLDPPTKTELKNYALRRLGFPAIDINVCDEQLDDLIEEAVDYFQEFAYNGSYKAFIKIEVTDAIKLLPKLQCDGCY